MMQETIGNVGAVHREVSADAGYYSAKAVDQLHALGVEPVFGQIKEGRGFRQFLLRGLEKVNREWSLICTGHNLLKLVRCGRLLADYRCCIPTWRARLLHRQHPAQQVAWSAAQARVRRAQQVTLRQAPIPEPAYNRLRRTSTIRLHAVPLPLTAACGRHTILAFRRVPAERCRHTTIVAQRRVVTLMTIANTRRLCGARGRQADGWFARAVADV